MFGRQTFDAVEEKGSDGTHASDLLPTMRTLIFAKVAFERVDVVLLPQLLIEIAIVEHVEQAVEILQIVIELGRQFLLAQLLRRLQLV